MICVCYVIQECFLVVLYGQEKCLFFVSFFVGLAGSFGYFILNAMRTNFMKKKSINKCCRRQPADPVSAAAVAAAVVVSISRVWLLFMLFIQLLFQGSCL